MYFWPRDTWPNSYLFSVTPAPFFSTQSGRIQYSVDKANLRSLASGVRVVWSYLPLNVDGATPEA